MGGTYTGKRAGMQDGYGVPDDHGDIYDASGNRTYYFKGQYGYDPDDSGSNSTPGTAGYHQGSAGSGGNGATNVGTNASGVPMIVPNVAVTNGAVGGTPAPSTPTPAPSTPNHDWDGTFNGAYTDLQKLHAPANPYSGGQMGKYYNGSDNPYATAANPYSYGNPYLTAMMGRAASNVNNTFDTAQQGMQQDLAARNATNSGEYGSNLQALAMDRARAISGSQNDIMANNYQNQANWQTHNLENQTNLGLDLAGKDYGIGYQTQYVDPANRDLATMGMAAGGMNADRLATSQLTGQAATLAAQYGPSWLQTLINLIPKDKLPSGLTPPPVVNTPASSGAA